MTTSKNLDTGIVHSVHDAIEHAVPGVVFDDVFDHSYDDEDDGARINSLFEKNHEILSNGFPLDETMKTRLAKNRTHYFTDFIKNLPDLD